MSSINSYVSKYLIGQECSPWSNGVDKLINKHAAEAKPVAQPVEVSPQGVKQVAERLGRSALFCLKAFALVIGVTAIASLLLVTEAALRLFTLGQWSVLRPLVAIILTPSSFSNAKGWDPKLLNAKPFLLVDEANANRPSLQAYHIPTLQAKKDKPSRLVVLCNPNGVGCEELGWLKYAMMDNIKHYPDENVEFLLFDYRGTGRSQGHMWHLNQAIDDAQLAASWAQKWTDSKKLDMASVTFSGYSLGGGTAATMGSRYPQAHLRLTHTFRSWTHAAQGMASKMFGDDLKWIATPIAKLLGGDTYAPEKALVQREILAKKMQVKPGSVTVEAALSDRMISRQAALFVPKSCCEGEFASQYKMRARFVDHMQF